MLSIINYKSETKQRYTIVTHYYKWWFFVECCIEDGVESADQPRVKNQKCFHLFKIEASPAKIGIRMHMVADVLKERKARILNIERMFMLIPGIHANGIKPLQDFVESLGLPYTYRVGYQFNHKPCRPHLMVDKETRQPNLCHPM